MKLLGQLCPDVHSLGSQQEGEAQVKETHLHRESKHMEVYSLSVCFFLFIVALDIKLELLPTKCFKNQGSKYHKQTPNMTGQTLLNFFCKKN